jgi:hypothetical protein
MADDGGTLCSVCGRRPAVYFRRYSGEYLCKRCLLRALAKSVKRQAGRSGVFRPRMDVLVPVSLWAPHLGLALTLALAEATRSLAVTIHVAVPSAGERRVQVDPNALLELSRFRSVRFWEARLRLQGPLPSTLRGCMRLDRAWAAMAARSVGAGAVALPVSRTTAILALLDSLLSGEGWGVSDASEGPLVASGVPLAPLFYGVEGEATAALAAAYRLYAWPACRPRSLGVAAFRSIARGRPELEFSFHKVARLMAGEASRRYGRCPVCGGYTPGEGPCPYCRLAGLEGVDVSPLRGPA